MFVTRNGTVKKTALSEYDKSRTNGLIAINLSEDDELVRVVETTGDDDIFIISKNGQTIRFSESAVRPMGRTAGGVRGMKLRGADVVVAAVASKNIDSRQLLIVTEGGFGKRTDLIHYPRKGRGTMGVRGIKLTEARGAAVVAARLVDVADQIILVSSGGVLIRTSVEQVAQQGRDASGVRVMSLGADESVAALAPVTVEDDEDIELVEDDTVLSSGESN